MSSVGKCARTLSAEKLGLLDRDGTTPEYLRLAAREGERHERYIREDLPEHGYSSLKAGGKLCTVCNRTGVHVEIPATTPLGHQVLLIGHLDDYCMDLSGTVVYIGEYKALGRFMCDILRDGIEDHRTYATQISLYHIAHQNTSTSPTLLGSYDLPFPVLYTIKNRDTGRMRIWTYPLPILSLESVLNRLDMVEECIAQNELAPCDADKDSTDKYSCTGLCDTGIDEAIPIPTTLTEHVGHFRTAKILEEKAKDLISEARGVFTAYMSASGRKRVKVDDMTISMVGSGTRKVYDIPDEVKKVYQREVERPPYIRVLDRKEEE